MSKNHKLNITDFLFQLNFIRINFLLKFVNSL